MGGWQDGRLPGAKASNQVWYSGDGKNWQEAVSPHRWSPRLGAAGVVFKGKMWVLGGQQQYHHGTPQDLQNDVWSSSDGGHWQQVATECAWSPRAFHQAVVFKDRMWLFGGGNYLPDYAAHNDVWSSSDGIEWTLENDNPPWPPRLWFSAAVYRDHIWVLGGWAKGPDNYADAWVSVDGIHWHPVNQLVPWKARHAQSIYVHNDQLWIAGGHARPLDNQVWALQMEPQNQSPKETGR